MGLSMNLLGSHKLRSKRIIRSGFALGQVWICIFSANSLRWKHQKCYKQGYQFKAAKRLEHWSQMDWLKRVVSEPSRSKSVSKTLFLYSVRHRRRIEPVVDLYRCKREQEPCIYQPTYLWP